MIIDEITTAHLRLRKLTPEVYDFIFTNFTDSELSDFLGAVTPEALQLEKTRYEANLTCYNKSFVFFQIIHRVDGKIIGGCGFHNLYIQHDRAELGYSLHTDAYKRQGLMSEALEAVLAFGFKELKLHRIEAFVSPSNIPSLRLMAKLSFTREGLMREHYLRDGIYEDSAVFSLLESEYKS